VLLPVCSPRNGSGPPWPVIRPPLPLASLPTPPSSVPVSPSSLSLLPSPACRPAPSPPIYVTRTGRQIRPPIRL
jgi:hypothetical protein